MNKMITLSAHALSEHEMNCLHLLAQGRDTVAIAAQTGASQEDVEHTLDEVAHKIGATSRLHAVIVAIRLGLVR